MHAVSSAYKASHFDPLIHKPPRVDKWGYNKETHKGRELLNRNAKNVLAEEVKVPSWWTGKRIRDKNFGATQSLAPDRNTSLAEADAGRSVHSTRGLEASP